MRKMVWYSLGSFSHSLVLMYSETWVLPSHQAG